MKTAAQTAAASFRACWWLPAGWVLMGFLLSLQTWVGGQLKWSEALAFGLAEWGAWVALAPAAVWLTFRFPVAGPAWPRALAVHLMGCVAAAAMLEAVASTSMPPRSGLPRGQLTAGPGFPAAPPRPPGPPHPWLMRLRLTGPLYWLLVTMAHLIHHRRLADERERIGEAELVEARLAALQSQLQPHFLFNSLNGISALIPNEPARAEQMLLALSRLLHAALAAGGRREVTLAEELQTAEAYLLIQQIRLGGALRIEREIGPGLFAAAVPPLLLQPLLENAFVHGLAGWPGKIRLTAGRSGNHLKLGVFDQRDASMAVKASSGCGIGLGNTRQRLQTLHGANHRFALTSTPAGTSVEIELPWREL